MTDTWPVPGKLKVVGTNVEVVRGQLLGEGGQGAVFECRVGSSAFALKWYRPGRVDQALRDRIGTLLHRGSPDARFLWPMEAVTDGSARGFGYLMPLAPSSFRPLADVFAQRTTAAVALDLRERALICLQIVDCFLKLHTQGFCYRDINLGSFLFDPSTCDVRLCDNDNIDVNGTTAPSVVTLEFMAPELVRGEAVASADTDLHSLAVVLFLVLIGSHPLFGRAEHEIDFRGHGDLVRLLGTEPRFMFDPQDHRNAALAGVHDREIAHWDRLPQALRDLFVQAFGIGLGAPRRRVLAHEWRPLLQVVRDTAVACACPLDFQMVVAGQTPLPQGGYECSYCGASLPRLPHLRIGSQTIVMTRAAKVFASHVREAAASGDPVVGVSAARQDGSPGLRNVGARTWQARTPDGALVEVAPGQAVLLAPGLTIMFGQAEGLVEV